MGSTKTGYKGLLVSEKLNFDPKTPAEAVQLCKDCAGISGQFMKPYYAQSRRFRDLYYVHLDLANLNPFQVHVRLGKIHSLIEMYAAKSVEALFRQKPYFPLFAKSPYWIKNAELMQDLLDKQSQVHKWFSVLTKATKMCHIDGTSFIEPYWQMMPKWDTIKVSQRVGNTDLPDMEEDVSVLEEGLRLRVKGLWEIWFDPMREQTGEMRWLIVKHPSSRAEVEMWLDAEMFSIDGKVTKKSDLKAVSSYRDKGDSLGNVMLSELESSTRGLDDDSCVLAVMYCPLTLTKYVFLDGETLIHKQTYRTARDFFVELSVLINTQDPRPNRLLGISDIMGVEQLAYYIDDSLSIALRADRQRLDQVLLYNKDAFTNFQVLSTVAGARIPITQKMLQTVGGDWDQLVHQLTPSPQSGDSYRIREELMNHFNESVGSNQTAVGSNMSGTQTAYEIRKMMESVDKKFAFKTALAEEIGLEPLAMLLYYMNGRNMTSNMITNWLGPEANKFLRKTPGELPGGAQVRLRGSALLSGEEAKKNERLAQVQAFAAFFPPEALAELGLQTAKDSQVWPTELMERLEEMVKPQPEQANAEPLPGMTPIQKPPIIGNLVPNGASTVTAGVGGMAA